MPDRTVCNILLEATSYSMVQQIINTVLFGVFGFRFGGLVLWVIWLVGCFFSKVRFDYFLKITESRYFWSSVLWHFYMSVYGVCKGGSLSMGSVSRGCVGMMFIPTHSAPGLVPAAVTQMERNLCGAFLSPVVLCPPPGTAQPSIPWSPWTRRRSRECIVLPPP